MCHCSEIMPGVNEVHAIKDWHLKLHRMPMFVQLNQVINPKPLEVFRSLDANLRYDLDAQM